MAKGPKTLGYQHIIYQMLLFNGTLKGPYSRR